MNTTREEAIALFKAALPPVAFAFLKNIDILAQDAITEPSPEQVAFCWSEAMHECNTVDVLCIGAPTGTMERNECIALLTEAGLLK
jgi:hypothetical protein